MIDEIGGILQGMQYVDLITDARNTGNSDAVLEPLETEDIIAAAGVGWLNRGRREIIDEARGYAAVLLNKSVQTKDPAVYTMYRHQYDIVMDIINDLQGFANRSHAAEHHKLLKRFD